MSRTPPTNRMKPVCYPRALTAAEVVRAVRLLQAFVRHADCDGLTCAGDIRALPSALCLTCETEKFLDSIGRAA